MSRKRPNFTGVWLIIVITVIAILGSWIADRAKYSHQSTRPPPEVWMQQ